MKPSVIRFLGVWIALACFLTHQQALAGMNEGAAVKAGQRVDLIGVRVVDVEGRHHRIGVSANGVQPAVLVFLDTACPVATRYVPVFNALHREAQAAGVTLYGVLSNPETGWRESASFVDDFSVVFPVVLDSAGDLALRLAPRVTSESFVVSTDNRLIYRGRIDDRFAAIGRLRTTITAHDLRGVIAELGRGVQPEPYATEAIGCFHHQWERLGGAGAGEITYGRHVASLLAANCVECHRQGGIAPFSLQDYSGARRWHHMIAYMTGERLMPPWRALPGFGEFRDARRLSDRQIEVLRAWSQSGAPLGDPADAPPPHNRPRSKWRLGEPDLVLRMQQPYDVPADGDDVYRYFVIPTGFSEDKVLVAMEFSPGDPRVVHHANFLLDFKDALAPWTQRTPSRASRYSEPAALSTTTSGASAAGRPAPIPTSSARARACGCPRVATWCWRFTIT